MPNTKWVDVPKGEGSDRTRLHSPRRANTCAGQMINTGLILLDLRTTIQNQLEQLEFVEIYGSGQTIDGKPVGDITFEYVGRKYKLTLEDRGKVKEMLAK